MDDEISTNNGNLVEFLTSRDDNLNKTSSIEIAQELTESLAQDEIYNSFESQQIQL